MSDIVPMIHPHQLASWQRRFKFCYSDVVQAHADQAEWKRGRCDLDFVIAANKRAIYALVEIYDLYSHDNERKPLRTKSRSSPLWRQRSWTVTALQNFWIRR